MRINRVFGPGLPAWGAVYSYWPRSNLVKSITYKSSQTGSAVGSVYRDLELNRDVLTSVTNKWPATSSAVSVYTYQSDILGLRQNVVRTGTAFNGQNGMSPSNLDAWSYNGRHELTGSLRYHSTDPNNPTNAQTALDRNYNYDPIGNRTDSTEGTNSTIYYCANNLNQYGQTATTSQPSVCTTQPVDQFGYDADGNMNSASLFSPATPCGLTWDAENRLIRVQPNVPQEGALALNFSYDYLGRRVEKQVQTYSSGAWVTTSKTRFFYYNWLLLAEYSVDLSTGALTLQHKYTWGLDLAGLNGQPNSITSAGGIGGLLAAYDTRGTSSTSDDKKYAYFYDGNGNVGQMMDVTGTGALAARYEYDPYGNITSQYPTTASTSFAWLNPWRHSTRLYDSESQLTYGCARYYLASIGRWISRDPAGAFDHDNSYAYVRNRPPARIDPFGLWSLALHKSITLAALHSLGCNVGCKCGNLNATVDGHFYSMEVANGLSDGVQWPDEPEGALAVAWSWLGFRQDSLSYRTHWGDLQYWHAMSSTEGSAQQLVDEIISQAQTYSLEFITDTDDKHCRSRAIPIGKILHTIQDSYSRSHTTRDSSGAISLFQDYTLQDSSKHSSADSEVNSAGYRMALEASKKFLDLVYCKNKLREGLEPLLRKELLILAPGARVGDTAPEFAPDPPPPPWWDKANPGVYAPD